jgi:hypothetical protein
MKFLRSAGGMLANAFEYLVTSMFRLWAGIFAFVLFIGLVVGIANTVETYDTVGSISYKNQFFANASLCKTEEIQSYINDGGDVNITHQTGATGLRNAAGSGCSVVVRMLLEAGAEQEYFYATPYDTSFYGTALQRALVGKTHAKTPAQKAEYDLIIKLLSDGLVKPNKQHPTAYYYPAI